MMTQTPETPSDPLAEALAEPKDVSGLTHIPRRVFLLALLIVLVNSWMNTHLGVDLTALLMIEGVTGLIAILRKPLGKDDAKAIDRALRRAVELLLGTRFLTTAFALFLLSGSLVSSVTFLAGGVEGIGNVELCADGRSIDPCSEADLNENGGRLRFVRLTNPLGRPFFVEAAGFQRHSFQLYPWIPAIVRASADLQRSPSILFRVEHARKGLGHFDIEGARIRVYDDTTGALLANVATDEETASLLLGPEVPITETFAVRWSRQLAAAGCPDPARPAALERWFNFAHTVPATTLAPGGKISAYFLDRGQAAQPKEQRPVNFAAVATNITVGTAPLKDVVLKRPLPPQNAPP